ncbi:MAG TPA: sigma-70 family RNA polymerase sigma factor, partial [Longimicrobiales bacterium]|nr:sigma-70 family RNA polymerase sigma factor [Longimicrobiales bacterium]
VQETCLAAVRHLAAVRDPAAVEAWLHTVLRRACLQRRRRQDRELLTDTFPDLADDGVSPEERIERLELRDWVWGALQRLPEPLRVTAMLRYFGSYDSYDELAAILGVPIGTVRSRLSEAKRRLAGSLLSSAGLVGDGRRAAARERERFWTEAFQDIFRRGESGGFLSHFASDLVVAWSSGRMARGRRHLAAEIEGDLAAGVRLDPERVLPGEGVTVVEGRLVNPPESPEHCPPGVALVLFGGAERAARIHLHLSPRPPRPAQD